MAEPRILVVDDEPDMVDNCVRILRRAGHRCLTATDPHRALTLLESERPDLLLTDLKMPGLGGLQVIHTIKRDHPGVAVVLLTGHGSAQDAADGLRLGAFDYLMKPVAIGDLVRILHAAAGRPAAEETPS